jgi:hypothetical protein
MVQGARVAGCLAGRSGTAVVIPPAAKHAIACEWHETAPVSLKLPNQEVHYTRDMCHSGAPQTACKKQWHG